jgi:N-acetylneuraminate synthase
MNTIQIGKTIISKINRPYFIADIGANHDGELERAYKLIELAKENGADAVKFQNFKADKIVSKQGFENLGSQLSHQKSWKKSVYEVYEDASIDTNWTKLLKTRCEKIGVEYMTSPYDFDSVDIVDEYLNAYKIGSGDITWLEIIEYIAKKQKPVLLATGAADFKEVKVAMNKINEFNKNIVIMQCNTNYTGSLENIKYSNLNVLKTYKVEFPNAILGLSDHTPGHLTVLGAIALGARVIEKHFTDDNSRVGPDHAFAMNPTTWKEMVYQSNLLFDALGDGIKKIEVNELESSIVQKRALYLTRDLKANSVLTKDDLKALRPIIKGAISPSEIGKVLGRKIKFKKSMDEILLWEDVENA